MEIQSTRKSDRLISTAQIRAARALVGWSQAELAQAAGLSRPTVERAETKGVTDATFATLMRALEKAGVIFVDENGEGPGVRLRKSRRR
jgi:transcriptional regulator with XRE-family HTH domain